jgi:hypothetical protein
MPLPRTTLARMALVRLAAGAGYAPFAWLLRINSRGSRLVEVGLARIRREEALLRAELEGYAACPGVTRYRLVPGIW